MKRLSIRTRLTLIYGGLFLVAGLVLLGVTYALVSHQLQPDDTRVISNSTGAVTGGASDNPPPAGALVEQAAADTRSDALHNLLTQGGLALGLVVITATGLGWLVAGRALQPLHRVTETARRIADAPAADRGLHERIALDGPQDELKELADTFDKMLARLDESFDGQRRFIANASHELRTPLALNRALLEVAMDPETATPETRQLGTTLLGVNARHERLIDGLLLLAKSENEVLDKSFVDIADIVRHVAASVPNGPVQVKVEAERAETTGDPVLLERLVQNLVENGLRYNVSEDGWLRLRTATQPHGLVVLEVSNTGPIVAPYDVPRLFEPFRRGGKDRVGSAQGAGLGLSIVRAVARAHGGDIHAEPRKCGGLVVIVTFPAENREFSR